MQKYNVLPLSWLQKSVKIPPGRAACPIAMAALARAQAGLVAVNDSF
jgi:hypothetical protein